MSIPITCVCVCFLKNGLAGAMAYFSSLRPPKIHPEVLTFRYAHKRGLYLVNPAPGRSQHLQSSPSNKSPSFKPAPNKIGEDIEKKTPQLFCG